VKIEVAYATPQRQAIIPLTVSVPCDAKQAILRSGICERFPEIDLTTAKIGIFSRPVSLTQPLRDGDRIEIYRPLTIDPKVARRQRVEKKRTA